LNAQLIEAEARRAERSLHPDAMDLCFQGRAWAMKGLTPEYMARAGGFFERALVLLRQKRQRIGLGADDGRWMSETVFAARTSRERSDESGHQALSHGRD